MPAMIEVENLVKWYGPTLAVDNLTFHIPAGEIVGFLGPNGAGKSTTLRILTGYLPPTSGCARIAGRDVLTDSRYVRSQIGYLPESNPLYPEMRVEEYLHFRGKLQSMDRDARSTRINEVCDRCGLVAVRRRLIGQLSRGNRQRVGLAASLLHSPPLLILDEPTAGLDPNQITQVRQLIRELREDHTVLLSTHILPEVEKIADRVLVIAAGRIVAQGSPDELRRRVTSGSRILMEIKANANEVVQSLDGVDGVAQVQTAMLEDWCRATIAVKDGRDLRQQLAEAMIARQWLIRELRFETASLEQFFVQATAQDA